MFPFHHDRQTSQPDSPPIPPYNEVPAVVLIKRASPVYVGLAGKALPQILFISLKYYNSVKGSFVANIVFI